MREMRNQIEQKNDSPIWGFEQTPVNSQVKNRIFLQESQSVQSYTVKTVFAIRIET